jgi:threonyl-tRNA synthetase
LRRRLTRGNPINARIAEVEKARVHTLLVIGRRDVDAGHVSVRLHSKGAKDEVLKTTLESINEWEDEHSRTSRAWILVERWEDSLERL